jgi:hypothetical protein
MAQGDIILEADGPGSYKFHFLSPSGELFGRVTVGMEGPPDDRSIPDQEKEARKRIAALAREFSAASGKA